jgi:uncharacterized protein YciI
MMTPQAWGGVTLSMMLLGAAPASTDAGPEPPPNMERYSLVILRRPANAPPVVDAAALQRQHLGHLEAMARAGKLVVAGPFDDQTDPRMRGLCIYRTSIDEARRLAQDDPMVKAGRLEVEVLSWWVEKGAITFPIGDDMARGKK